MDMDNSVVISGVGGWGKWRSVERGKMVMGRDLMWGEEHTIQCTEDVCRTVHLNLHNFVNQCHPNKFNKGKKRKL